MDEQTQIIETEIAPVNRRVLTVLPDAPVSDKMDIPLLYGMDKFGITKNIGVGKRTIAQPILHAPLVVTAILENLEGVQWLEVAYLENNRWKFHTEERTLYADRRKIIKLAGIGLPVDSNNAGDVVGFIEDFIAYNQFNIPRKKISDRLGYIEEAKPECGFLLGKKLVGCNEPISLCTTSGGENDTANAFCSSGSYEEWRTLIIRVQVHRRVMFAIFSALVPPILSFITCGNLIEELVGGSSVGKTTALELIASIYGKPSQNAGGLVKSWNSTLVSIERTAGFCNFLPLFLDDLQTANKEHLETILYLITNGRGRERGSIIGYESSRSWRTVLLSTGETSLFGSSNFDGARARVISLWGSPFNEGTPVSLINDIKRIVRSNYGHFAPVYIEHVIKNKEKIQPRYEALERHFQEHARSGLSNRMAGYFAAIATAGEFFSELIPLAGNPIEIVQDVFEKTARPLDSDNLVERALDAISAWAQQFAANFEDSPVTANIKPIFQYGKWFENGALIILPQILKEALTKMSFDPLATIKALNQAGHLDTDAGRLDKKVMLAGGRVRCYCVKRPQEIAPVETSCPTFEKSGAGLGQT